VGKQTQITRQENLTKCSENKAKKVASRTKKKTKYRKTKTENE
jgi:hypothetical protein